MTWRAHVAVLLVASAILVFIVRLVVAREPPGEVLDVVAVRRGRCRRTRDLPRHPHLGVGLGRHQHPCWPPSCCSRLRSSSCSPCTSHGSCRGWRTALGRSPKRSRCWPSGWTISRPTPIPPTSARRNGDEVDGGRRRRHRPVGHGARAPPARLVDRIEYLCEAVRGRRAVHLDSPTPGAPRFRPTAAPGCTPRWPASRPSSSGSTSTRRMSRPGAGRLRGVLRRLSGPRAVAALGLAPADAW